MQLTECLKICCQQHVHCTQHVQRYRNTTWWIQPAQRRALDTMHVHCTQYMQRHRNTTWRIQPAQRRALDTMNIAHNTEIQIDNMIQWIQPARRRALDTMYIAHNKEIQIDNMVDTACSKTGSRHHVHCTQHRDTEIQHGGYSLLKDGLSTPCTCTQHRDTAHNKELQKYNMVDTACSKTGSRHHVHCTQHRDTDIQHGGYSLLKDGLSTPCTLHTTKRYRYTTWWIQPAQRRALDTMYIAHNTEIQKYNMVDTACSKTGSRHVHQNNLLKFEVICSIRIYHYYTYSTCKISWKRPWSNDR